MGQGDGGAHILGLGRTLELGADVHPAAQPPLFRDNRLFIVFAAAPLRSIVS
jgi:hypothetical protein